MIYDIKEILDITSLKQVFEAYTKSSNLTLALLDLSGKVHIATGWQQVCLQYHRANPQSAKNCLESDTILSAQSNQGLKFNIYNCKNGLVDVSIPVYLYGEHIANFFTGQFFFEKPDYDLFREQAKKFGYRENDYIDALKKVPIFTKEEVEKNVSFLVGLTEVFGRMGVAKLDQIQKVENTSKKSFQKEVTNRTRNLEIQIREAGYEIRAKNEFLSSMSHELRTPLNAIIGLSELLSLDTDLSKTNQEYVKVITSASEHLLALINDVLELSKIEAEAIKVHLAKYNIEEVFKETEELSHVLSFKHQVEVNFEYPENIYIYSDRIRLKQILFNLISNAIKYNKPEGSVSVYTRLDNDFVEIHVKDNGLGISEEKQVYLFEAFNRLGAERSNIEGTGIGLIIAKRLVELIGGTINFKSKIGEGSDFWVKVPLSNKIQTVEQPEAQSSKDKSLLSQELNTEEKIKNVIYVEDNKDSIFLMNQIFSKRDDIHLKTFISPDEAIQYLKSHHVDLILLDINVPEKDGFEMIELIKSELNLTSVPIVAISAKALPSEVQEGLDFGFDAYLTKPLNVSNFLKVTASLLKSKRV